MNTQNSVLEAICSKFQRDTSKYPSHLHENLAGIVKFEIKDTGDSCFIEPAAGKVLDKIDNPDLYIRMYSGDAKRVLSGDLNPQIAMLSGKIHIEGRAELAMYLFNVLSFNEHEH